MIAIQTANLTKKYGDIIAINGVDLEVEAGEIVGCLGPERSGKNDAAAPFNGSCAPDARRQHSAGTFFCKRDRKLRAKSGIVNKSAACIGSDVLWKTC